MATGKIEVIVENDMERIALQQAIHELSLDAQWHGVGGKTCTLLLTKENVRKVRNSGFQFMRLFNTLNWK